MKIGIDARCLMDGRRTGVEEYTINLLENLFCQDNNNEYILFLNSLKKSGTDLNWLKKYPNVSLKMFRFPNKLLNLFFWYWRWPKIDKLLGGVDIFFMPNINFAAVSGKTKLILTIHDLSFEYFPETFSSKRRLWHFFINPKKLIQKSDKIIAVSDSTKSDLINFYGISEKKIKVIYNGLSSECNVIDRNSLKLIQIKEKYKLPYKFILYLGTIEPRKNIIGLIKAYNILKKIEKMRLGKYKLVIAGAKGWKSKQIFSEIKKSPFKHSIIFTGIIDNKDKPAFYNLASLFVYPSFFEGFGFPPLEAMKCGIPIITSNISSLPEIVNGAGILIDPDKPDEIYQAIKNILLNNKLQEDLIRKGLTQSAKFNWKKTAEEFLVILSGVKNPDI